MLVQIDDVGKSVEGVEGNADGQDDVERQRVDLEPKVQQQLRKGFRKEVEIFEHAQKAKAEHDADPEPELPHVGAVGGSHELAGQVNQYDGNEQ